MLANATVELVSISGAISSVVQSTTADGAGTFRFENVAPGQYELRATYEGFTPASTRLRVGPRPPGAQKLVLAIAGLKQEITVSNAATEVEATASSNVDAVAVDQSMLESLPVFDHDYVATLSRFLDTGSLGNGGVTVVVNGMEVNALNVSASAVQQIRINQDPYSAEYSRPGRGRIEILTKPGTQEYHGDVNLIFRDAHLNARNAFATIKPPEQRQIFEGFLGGPLGAGGKTSFMLSANDERNDQQAFVYAIGPAGIIQDTLPQASGRSLVTGSITHQISDQNTFSIRPNYQYESDENRGVGGMTLASAGTTFKHHEQQVTYTQQTILRPTLLNQFQMLFGHEREPTTSRSAERGIVVAGAFTGGGGQGDLVRTETHINLNESLAWTHGKHLVQAGFQLPDWSRRGFYDRSNFGGTFYFSSLDTYSAGQPYAFTQQQGNGDLAFLEKLVGTYIKDDWQVRPGLSIGFGLALRLAELLSRRQQPRAPLLARFRAGQHEDERLPRRSRRLQRPQRPGGHRRRPAFTAWRARPLRHHQPGISRSVLGRERRGVTATKHRATRAGRADSADVPVQRRPRSSAAEEHHAFGHLHRRARLSPVSLARHQRAAAAVVCGAPQSGVRRGAADRIDRPPGERLAAGDHARQGDALVQRADAIHAQPCRTTTPTASRRFQPTTTTFRANGPAPTSIAATVSCCSAVSARAALSTLAWG